MVTVEQCCEILDSMRIPVTASERECGEYPYYGANGIQGYVSNYIFDDELVLVAEDGGNFGSKEKPIAYRVSGKCWVNNHAHVLKPKEDLDVEYLCYSLMFYRVEGMINGATRKKLTQKALRQMKIPMLKLDEQIKIATQIKHIEMIKEKRLKQLQKLDELIQARFVEMFENCKNMVSINDLCSIITDGTHQPPKFQKEGIPFIFVSNLANNIVTYNTEKYIDEETYSELYKRTPIEIGDILLSTVGSYGHPAVVTDTKRFLFQRHIAFLKPKHNIINSFYLHRAILAPNVQRQIEDRVKGIAQKTLNLSEIRKIVIPVPNVKEQNQFADFVNQVHKSKLVIKNLLQIYKHQIQMRK